MTDEMERRAEEVFAHLDDLGGGSILEGVYLGIDNGFFVGEIADAAYRFERQVNRGQRIVVGVNAHNDGDDHRSGLLRIDQDTEDLQLKRLAEVKQDRSDESVDTALEQLVADASDPDVNLMPAIIDAVVARATEGEVVHALEGVFGTYVEESVV